MTVRRTSFLVALVALTWLASLASLGAEDATLARAKGLYRAAAYDEALALLTAMTRTTPGVVEIAEYRAFCLLALDRREEAEDVIAALVTENPAYRVSESQASPRIQAVFADVRRTRLPSLVRQSYDDAKAAFDTRDPSAADRFDGLLKLLNEPEVASNPAFADLKTVATGFRDLSTAIAGAGQAPPPASEAPGGVARSTDFEITPPVPLSQAMPRWSPPHGSEVREWMGTLEIVIDERGDVASAELSTPIHPNYDPLLLRAARSWKYRPALKSGTPTRYVKAFNIRLDATKQ